MLEDGLSYPVRGEWVGRIIIGGALSLFAFLLIPIFFVNGYLLQVLEETIAGEDEPPEFTDWGTLFAKGIGSFVIVLAYSIVPIFLYVVVVTTFLGGGAAVGGDPGGLLAGFGVLSMILLIPVVLFVYYLIPAALANYAYDGELTAGFDFVAIKQVVLSTDYLIAVILPIVVAVILWIGTAILAITVLGLLLVPFLQFYGQVAIFRMFGVAFARNTERIPTESA